MIFLLLFISHSQNVTFAQVDDNWMRGQYPKGLHKTTLLVQKIDNALKLKWVPDYQKSQANKWKSYKYDYILIDKDIFEKKLKDTKYKDIEKYRYILEVQMGHAVHANPGITATYSHTTYIYNFYDRKTGKWYNRIDYLTKTDFGKSIATKLNRLAGRKDNQ